MQKKSHQRIAIKVGSNVLTGNDGRLNHARMGHIVEQISTLKSRGIEIILISSGAVAAGRSLFPETKHIDTVSARQLWSAVGQVKLINTYSELFSKNGLHCAQVLTTKENFSDRRHYLNMQNCINTMLENNVIPIVNENDTISVTELMFTDNDELSGLISSMMNCQSLIILSNVDGIYNGNPNDKNSTVIENIKQVDSDYERYILMQKSGFGRGGMQTKYNIAKKIASEGIDVYIANGTRDNIITGIVDNEDIPHTRFQPNGKKLKSSKKWLAHSESFAKGIITVNQGAKEALLGIKANSLLLIGVTNIKGFFKKNDIIRIEDEEGKQLGLGKSQYNSDEAIELMGKKTQMPLIYYDYMFLYV